MNGDPPPYRRILEALRRDIETGRLKPGDRIPSENEIVAAHGVSRMTANRAVRELAAAGLVRRTVGSGTFVAPRRLDEALLRVPDIAQDIRAAAFDYAARVILREERRASEEVAEALQLAAGAPVFRTLIVHLSGGQPLQIEDRHVNPAFAPDYLGQDFAKRSPNAYLTAIAPPDEAEQVVEAIAADREAARLLAVPLRAPCLRVTRRTWSRGLVATFVRLTAPGDRWRLSARFRP